MEKTERWSNSTRVQSGLCSKPFRSPLKSRGLLLKMCILPCNAFVRIFVSILCDQNEYSVPSPVDDSPWFWSHWNCLTYFVPRYWAARISMANFDCRSSRASYKSSLAFSESLGPFGCPRFLPSVWLSDSSHCSRLHYEAKIMLSTHTTYQFSSPFLLD